jgi:hypothetical protein
LTDIAQSFLRICATIAQYLFFTPRNQELISVGHRNFALRSGGNGVSPQAYLFWPRLREKNIQR